MKKVLIGFGIFLVVLIAALALIPYLFKDQIKAMLDRQIAETVDARVLYETDNVSFSLLRNFPNFSLGIDHLAVVGTDSFSRDTLAYIPSFRMGLDVMSVIRGNTIKVRSITLDQPQINLIVLKSGKANWDIMIPDTAAAADTAASEFNLAIKGWQVNNGQLRYEDRTMPLTVLLQNVNHSGSGDFEQNVFDMESHTKADRFTMIYDGMKYIDRARLDADVTLAMDLNESLYAFKENNIRLNDFALTLDGAVQLPEGEDYIDLDLTFAALETDFRNVLSIVPGFYKDTEEFRRLRTDGRMAFTGYLKGRQSETSTPGYGTDLKITDGMFQYPDLPQAARNINLDLTVDNPDGNPANMVIDVRRLHLDLGPNPVDARVLVQGLEPMRVDGNVKAIIDLAEMTKVYPVEDMVLRGLLNVDAVAKGTYSETSMPVVTANLNLRDGYVKSADFPAPIEQLNMVTTITNSTGNVNDTRVNVERFNMLLDREPLEGRMLVQNIHSPSFDGQVKGILDLTKLTKIFPLEGMTVTGRLNGDVAFRGRMSDVEAERYQNITASGRVGVTDLTYVSQDLPQGMRVTAANATFNNDKIVLADLTGFLGTSDVRMNGTISNYMGYAFADNQPLRGTVNVSSNKFNVNEWMVDEQTGKPVAEPTQEAQGVVEVPANLDFVVTTAAQNVVYDNLNLQNLRGQMVIRDQTVRLENMNFSTLGGTFGTSGSYSTKDLTKPSFSLNLNIQNLDFEKAFQAFNTVQAIAPITKFLEGRFSTNLNLPGLVGQDMMPVLNSLTGKGVVDVIRAAVDDLQILDRISAVTNLREMRDLVVENRRFGIEFVNGAMVVSPFDLNVGDINMKVGGTNRPDGTIDYNAALDVPTGKVGAALSDQLASRTGLQNLRVAERVTLDLNIGGTLTNPQVGLAGGSVRGQAKEVIKDAVQEKVDLAKERLDQERQELEARAKAELEQRRLEAEQKVQAEIDKRRAEAETRLKKEAEQRVGTEVRDRASDLLRRLPGGRNPAPTTPAPTTPAPTTPAPATPEPAPQTQPDTVRR
ncbi:hypothetical protein BH24BAC1_BH24BAC1_09510 [soil metagenome]